MSVWTAKGERQGVRCAKNDLIRAGTLEDEPCPVSYAMREIPLRAGVREIINIILDGHTLEEIAGSAPRVTVSTALDAHRKELVSLEGKLVNLIRLQSDASATLLEYYQAEIQALDQRITYLKTEIATAESMERREHQNKARRAATIDELRSLKVDGLYALPEYQQNQILRSLLGKFRFVGSKGRIIGVTMP